MATQHTWQHPYDPDPNYGKRVAYLCMEFAIDQPLKIYSGGLGYLAGSHMRSGFELKQNLIGVGMLWKYGYYDQNRDEKGYMKIQFQERHYPFLEDTGIIVPVYIKGFQVLVKAFYLPPEIFNTVPMYLLTTDIPENDHLSTTITNRLYDANEATRIAQSIVLGIGGAKVIEALGGTELYHINEAHALPIAFHLYGKHKSLEEVKKRLVFTTHTPEKAGNSERDIRLLDDMGFFGTVPLETVREITQTTTNNFEYTPAALRLSKVANGVSQLHGKVSRKMWADYKGICEIDSITNSQNFTYWHDQKLWEAYRNQDEGAFIARKKEMKADLFEIVADQTGCLFDPDILTIVWARRFAGYKRADLIMRDIDRFDRLVNNPDMPLQIIWSGKPYPEDNSGVSMWDHIRHITKRRKNLAVLNGYELALSAKLKKGSDVWLNTPRRPQEASGTSGMTAAMNGSVNFSINDGWIPEFGKHGQNAFIIPQADTNLSHIEVDDTDHLNMMRILEEEIVPMYYQDPTHWYKIAATAMNDVVPQFGSNRMAHEYYEKLYKY